LVNSEGPRFGSSLRLIVLGMPCAFTREVLAAAMAHPANDHVFDVRAIILASDEQGTGATGCIEQDWPAGVPVESVSRRSAFISQEFRERIAALAPDVIIVACFPWRIPRAIRTMPRFGCLNVHPSLLPDGRGPEPVFWAFRRGLRQTGVTVHRMDDGLDTGPILAQDVVDIGVNATIASLEVELARIGGRLLGAVIRDLGRGVVREREQPAGEWTSAPFPTNRDLLATTAWSAEHVASFIRAVAPAHGPIPLLIVATGRTLPCPIAAEDVLAADDRATQAEPLAWEGDTVRVRCTPGIATVRLPRPTTSLVLRPPGRSR
jgi:methionyl-tRNA formyltransferase